jgi:FAD/FMN-containing dehydrogenase
LLASGEVLRCSREENADVFHAAIGGMGLLGAVTRLRLQLKPVESGYLRVHAFAGQNLKELFQICEREIPQSDYVVGWVDCTARGRSLGCGVVHSARAISANEDPDGPESLLPERQALPSRIMGFPRQHLPQLMRPFMNGTGVRLVNKVRYRASRMRDGASYLQSHVAFSFLLDYVPNWWLAYGKEGLIQYQVFLPKESACGVMEELLRRCQAEGLPPYLGVLKRHRSDDFLLSHGVDGWSLALDFRVTARARGRLWALTEQMTERVLEAQGRFYLAKDAVLRAGDLERVWGKERLGRFLALKSRLDPENTLSTELSRRLFGR